MMMQINDELSSINPPPLRGDPLFPNPNQNPNSNPNPNKRKRNLPGTPDPDAEVIAMSPKSLMATNRFVCEICSKGFQRDQNLQLHRRGHNLPWKLKQRNKEEVVRKKVYICPEKSCAHHHPSRALGDLTGIKKHYSRKHGEKKWKCDKCSKKYAVMSDWKAHNKICGTREYKCDCGTLFSRKDSFITHRAFCDALVEESARFNNSIPGCRSGVAVFNNNNNNNSSSNNNNNVGGLDHGFPNPSPDYSGVLEAGSQISRFPLWLESGNYPPMMSSLSSSSSSMLHQQQLQVEQQWLGRGQEESFVGGVLKEEEEGENKSLYYGGATTNSAMSATALLQKAAQMGSTRSGAGFGLMSPSSFSTTGSGRGRDDQSRIMEGESSLTRDFLGVGGKELKSNFFAMEMPHFNRNH